MPSFEIEGFSLTSQAHVHLKRKAANKNELVEQLAREQIQPAQIEELAEKGGFGSRKVKYSVTELLFFYKSLSIMLKSRYPLADAFHAEGTQAINPNVGERLIKISRDLNAGINLGEATKESGLFPVEDCECMQAGQQHGNLAIALTSMSDQYTIKRDAQSAIRKAVTMPLIVLNLALSVGTGLQVFAVPQMAKMTRECLGKRPMDEMQSAIFGANAFFCNIWWILAAAYIGFNVMLFVSPSFRSKVLTLISKRWRLLRLCMHDFRQVRMLSAFRAVYDAKAGTVAALQAAAKAMTGTPMKEELEHALVDLKNGIPLSMALQNNVAVDPRIIKMIKGTENYPMHETLQFLSEMFREFLMEKLDAIKNRVGPITMIFGFSIIGLTMATVGAACFAMMQALANSTS